MGGITPTMEVKVIFTKKSIESLLKQHLHQLQLGLLIHKCRKGRLLVYVAPSQMSELEASAHSVEHAQLDVGTFQKDDNWVQVFTTKSHDFYTNHLMWFYKPIFDAEEACAHRFPHEEWQGHIPTCKKTKIS
jgi:hypothetical protein